MAHNKIQVTPVHVLHHHRLYERYIFFYIVIMSVWLILASYVFTHYKIDTWTVKQNLALGFLYYLFFAAMIAITPFWYRITLHRFTETDKYQQAILETLEETATQQEYDEMADFLEQNGEIIPSFKQTLALMAIFWVLIFELYFLYSWIDPKTLTFLWQPEWMKSLSQWVISHTNTDSFGFAFDAPNIPRSKTWRATMQSILDTPQGHTLAAIHVWFMFSYAILLFCVCKTFWRAVDWLGFERVNPRNIHSVGRFLWASFASLPFWIFFVVSVFSFMMLQWFATIKMATVIDVSRWFVHLKLYLVSPIFFLFSVKGFLGWFQFWQRILSKLIRWLRSNF